MGRDNHRDLPYPYGYKSIMGANEIPILVAYCFLLDYFHRYYLWNQDILFHQGCQSMGLYKQGYSYDCHIDKKYISQY